MQVKAWGTAEDGSYWSWYQLTTHQRGLGTLTEWGWGWCEETRDQKGSWQTPSSLHWLFQGNIWLLSTGNLARGQCRLLELLLCPVGVADSWASFPSVSSSRFPTTSALGQYNSVTPCRCHPQTTGLDKCSDHFLKRSTTRILLPLPSAVEAGIPFPPALRVLSWCDVRNIWTFPY